MFRSSFSHDAPKTLIFDALLCVKADFLMMLEKGAHLLHFYAEKQVFSCPAKTLVFDALIRGKAGFLVTRPKKECTFDALLRFVAVFSQNAPKSLIFDASLYVKADFLMTRPKKVYI